MLDKSAVSLDGKVAVVSGGGGGIGKGISCAMAAYGAGVAIAESDPGRAAEVEEEIRTRGGRAKSYVVDVRESAQVAAMAKNVIEDFGRVDVLVNNVGDFLGAVKPFVKSSEDEWEDLYSINLKHIFHCTRAFVPHIIAGGRGGSVINVSTIEAFRGIPGCAVYAAFKSAITGFTKSLALELGPESIRVNAIAPETTETLQVQPSRWLSEDRKKLIPYWTPLGRFGTPDDAAGCAVFLASELSAWVSGTTINLDGGALAAGGFYRVPEGGWTNLPVVAGAGIEGF